MPRRTTYLVKATDNPEGVDPKVFNETCAGIKADRPSRSGAKAISKSCSRATSVRLLPCI
jgi:hypothetical protein